LAGPEIMFAVVVFGGFKNQNGGDGTVTVFHFWESGNSNNMPVDFT